MPLTGTTVVSGSSPECRGERILFIDRFRAAAVCARRKLGSTGVGVEHPVTVTVVSRAALVIDTSCWPSDWLFRVKAIVTDPREVSFCSRGEVTEFIKHCRRVKWW
jgi:hypothetical protein